MSELIYALGVIALILSIIGRLYIVYELI
jgi:cbb3-type cytochrome oxidase subunit 3